MKSLITKMAMKRNFLHSLLGERFNYFKKSYSQFGEDLRVLQLIESPTTGYYLDIGAHHPIFLSNTLRLSTHGMMGINVDGSKDSITEFEKHRPSEINLNCIVGLDKEVGTLYEFSQPALNTSNKDRRDALIEKGYEVIRTTETNVMSMGEILDKHAPTGKEFSFLNVDVEGLDLEVLKTNDWSKYRPKIVCVEEYGFDLGNPEKSEIYNFMREKNYRLNSKLGPSLIFTVE